MKDMCQLSHQPVEETKWQETTVPNGNNTTLSGASNWHQKIVVRKPVDSVSHRLNWCSQHHVLTDNHVIQLLIN